MKARSTGTRPYGFAPSLDSRLAGKLYHYRFPQRPPNIASVGTLWRREYTSLALGNIERLIARTGFRLDKGRGGLIQPSVSRAVWRDRFSGLWRFEEETMILKATRLVAAEADPAEAALCGYSRVKSRDGLGKMGLSWRAGTGRGESGLIKANQAKSKWIKANQGDSRLPKAGQDEIQVRWCEGAIPDRRARARAGVLHGCVRGWRISGVGMSGKRTVPPSKSKLIKPNPGNKPPRMGLGARLGHEVGESLGLVSTMARVWPVRANPTKSGHAIHEYGRIAQLAFAVRAIPSRGPGCVSCRQMPLAPWRYAG